MEMVVTKFTLAEKNRIIKIIILSTEYNDVGKLNNFKDVTKNDIFVIYHIFTGLKHKTKTDIRIINKINKIIIDKV